MSYYECIIEGSIRKDGYKDIPIERWLILWMHEVSGADSVPGYEVLKPCIY